MCRFDWLVVLLLILFGAVFGLILAGNIVLEVDLTGGIAAVAALISAVCAGGLLYVAYMARNQWKEQHDMQVLGAVFEEVRRSIQVYEDLLGEVESLACDSAIYKGWDRASRYQSAMSALQNYLGRTHLRVVSDIQEDLRVLAESVGEHDKKAKVFQLVDLVEEARRKGVEAFEVSKEQDLHFLLHQEARVVVSMALIRAFNNAIRPALRKVRVGLYEVQGLNVKKQPA